MQTPLPTFPWQTLLDWYKEYGRHDLPWREYDHDIGLLTYRVWLSEIFLQQTQVSRVIGYFERVMERFPTLGILADTDYETFFPYYQGLGYYSRARNILKTAKIIHDEYGGVFPRSKKILEKLPGVGGYTASAILAFGYGEPYLAWDTNLEKVFARYYHGSRLDKLTDREKERIEEDFRNFCIRHCEEGVYLRDEGRGNPDTKKMEQTIAMTKPRTIRAINNALMDFASLVDLKNPAQIDWDKYPIKSGIFYEARGSLEPVEIKKSQSFPIPDATVVVVLHRDHRVYYSDPHFVIQNESEEFAQFQKTRADISRALDMTERLGSSYFPFILLPALHRDTRRYVQEFFRERYGLELSVRPVHKKWLSEDGKPYIAVNAQVQVGKVEFLEFYSKK